ncbi:orotate phosphoribosyltransferase [Candidatus Kinetoplastibacterium blastocrithidii TCC012E]|uniref:Orotate phosphoribosyltransferase n=1 Tax=Candidatus Kinetoplastidibacterium blastocrithidiae TCC012E TaxID=1208922 RepID=M1LX44_9PROT|nr:orotate phosphoribosyltransferase [Candidatus Kinetoplastibacterium blastocrithidii]AGF50092.1 orotate phosphoribosyltransferase [Candidatus Kinetoplastibacterium blastocrithidii TCC012E]
MISLQKNAVNFVKFALQCKALCFGSFETKSGRNSPYFFNIGCFDSGYSINKLSRFYTNALVNSGIAFDMIFGPAYKGIPLVISTSINYSLMLGKDIPFSFNRKEMKTHGEGGLLIGSPLKGRVVIIDDVITSGISAMESISIIKKTGAEPVAMLIALDRMECSVDRCISSRKSAVQEVAETYGIPVISIASLNDIFSNVMNDINLSKYRERISEYREVYGIL